VNAIVTSKYNPKRQYNTLIGLRISITNSVSLVMSQFLCLGNSSVPSFVVMISQNYVKPPYITDIFIRITSPSTWDCHPEDGCSTFLRYLRTDFRFTVYKRQNNHQDIYPATNNSFLNLKFLLLNILQLSASPRNSLQPPPHPHHVHHATYSFVGFPTLQVQAHLVCYWPYITESRYLSVGIPTDLSWRCFGPPLYRPVQYLVKHVSFV
jgi:hypothetical protein